MRALRDRTVQHAGAVEVGDVLRAAGELLCALELLRRAHRRCRRASTRSCRGGEGHDRRALLAQAGRSVLYRRDDLRRSRCSGTGGPTARCGPPRRPAPGRARAARSRRPAFPACRSRTATRRRARTRAAAPACGDRRSAPRASARRRLRSRARGSGTPASGRSSTLTVQAPQTPWLQPRLAAVSCRRSRSTVSSVSCSAAATGTASPLMRSVSEDAMPFMRYSRGFQGAHRAQQQARDQRRR